jgi:hypothetical protein
LEAPLVRQALQPSAGLLAAIDGFAFSISEATKVPVDRNDTIIALMAPASGV